MSDENTTKIFTIVLSTIVLVAIAVVVTGIFSASGSACTPQDLYADSQVVGFGGGLVNTLYDSVCTSLLNANSAVWGFYKNFLTGLLGQKENVAAVGADLWGMAAFFCKEDSNFDYVTSNPEGAGAISNTETFRQLFTHEVERCWTLFEGRTKTPLLDRDPLGRHASFDCAEIIYDFSGTGGYVTLAELYAMLASENACGNERNTPAYINENSANKIASSIMWCAPKDKMVNYWNGTDTSHPGYYTLPSSFEVSGPIVDAALCPSSPTNQVKNYASSMCLPFSYALCSLPYVEGYRSLSSISPADSDDSAVIEGCGKIVISFFDYFDTTASSDNYAACGNLDVFNNYAAMGRLVGVSTIPFTISDSVVVCYQKYSSSDGACSFS